MRRDVFLPVMHIASLFMSSCLVPQVSLMLSEVIFFVLELNSVQGLLENVEHCGGEHEQAANIHMNRLSFTLK